MNCIRQLCRINAGRHEMEQFGTGGFTTPRPPRMFGAQGGPPPPKRMRADGEGTV